MLNGRRVPRPPKQMFVSPLRLIRNPDTHRVIKVEVDLMAAGKKTMTTLAYGDQQQASQARQALVDGAKNICPVPNWRVWKALQIALQQVSSKT